MYTNYAWNWLDYGVIAENGDKSESLIRSLNYNNVLYTWVYKEKTLTQEK